MKRIRRIEQRDGVNLELLNEFIGKSCAEIDRELSLDVKLTSRSFARTVIDRMIQCCGVDINPKYHQYKMIRVDEFGYPKNPSPFKTTDYTSIIQEEWEDSEFKKLLEPTYIYFIVTHGTPESSIFKGYAIHEFSEKEIESAKNVWLDTRNKIRSGTYDRFLTDKETRTFFFKQHAASVASSVETPQGGLERVRSFWISRTLLSKIILPIH